jgi:4-diphosphocytidyl-2-C-methyl-D-erythritol kinase
VSTLPAPAKINLSLVVGPRRQDGKHELATVYERIDLVDRLSLETGPSLRVTGFSGDTLVGAALRALAGAAGAEPGWSVEIEKRIPVAAGLGGGSSDAASALRLGNATLERPLEGQALRTLAASIGADVPFFLQPGPQLGGGDGTHLSPLELPQDYTVVLVLPQAARKASTAAVYEAFDRLDRAERFEERRTELHDALSSVRSARDLARLPANDLASSPLAAELRRLGAFRADVSGAGPVVYGLFERKRDARAARHELRGAGASWIAAPTWYG